MIALCVFDNSETPYICLRSIIIVLLSLFVDFLLYDLCIYNLHFYNL